MAETPAHAARLDAVKLPDALVFHPSNGLFFEDKSLADSPEAFRPPAEHPPQKVSQ